MRTSWLERGGFWDKGKKQAEKPELPVIRELPVESIRPNPAQPRLSYESGALEELAESIRENGLIQPILVRQLLDGDYELIAGHRRWMAVRKLGQPTIRAIVENRTDTESAVLALVENIQRRDLDCMEEARAIAGLIESTGMTQQEAARRLGKSQPAVANKLRLLRLPGWVQEIVEEGQLSERHARALLRLEREEDLRRDWIKCAAGTSRWNRPKPWWTTVCPPLKSLPPALSCSGITGCLSIPSTGLSRPWHRPVSGWNRRAGKRANMWNTASGCPKSRPIVSRSRPGMQAIPWRQNADFIVPWQQCQGHFYGGFSDCFT